MSGVRAFLFDLDGVLTPTVDLHTAAWARLFGPFLAYRGIEPGYTDADYHAHLDGRSRSDGVRAMLAARGIVLPEGVPDDDGSHETVWGLGNRKNIEFQAVLEANGVVPYPGSLAFLDAALATGCGLAVVTSSRNGRRVLEVAGIRDRFTVVVDGLVAVKEGLRGKPAPDTYLYAAHHLGYRPSECAVLEDAISGVASGRAGAFGLVIGVDRGVGARQLLDAGADLAVGDLDELLPLLGSASDSNAVHPEPKLGVLAP